MKWTEDDLTNVIDLLKNGKDYQEIADLTGRDKNSIRVKMGKIGENYLKYNPPIKKICLECENEILNAGIKFCSNSCSVSYSNRLRVNKKIIKCLTCDCEIKTNQKNNIKFCSRGCFNLHRKKLKFAEIENGTCKSNDSQTYKNYFIDKYGEECMECGWCEINPHTGKIPLELHHKDGNPDNNKLDNLELLCPNHHSLSNNWKGAILGNGRYSRRRVKRRENYKAGKSC